MIVTKSKLVMLALVAAYVIFLVTIPGWGLDAHAYLIFAFIIGSVILVWFPEHLGGITSMLSHTASAGIDVPPGLVAGLGWVMFCGFASLHVIMHLLSEHGN